VNDTHILRQIAGNLSGQVSEHLLREDTRRIENSWFGLNSGPKRPEAVAVYIGGRSGLELLLAHHRFPDAKLHVVEHDERIRHSLEMLAPFATYHGSVTEMLASISIFRKIDFLRIDELYYAEAAKSLFARAISITAMAVALPKNIDWYSPVVRLRRLADDVFIRHADGSFRFDTPCAPFDVSVIVPAFKVEEYLPQCLDSLARQTMDRIEIIVMDDGSPDACGAIANQFALDFPGRVRVIHQQNAGCAAARAAGLASAQGEFVGFVDGDDWVDHNMFGHLHMLALKHGTDIAQCGFRLEYETGETKPGSDIYAGDGNLGRSGVIWNVENVMTVQPSIWRRIYRKSFLVAQKITFPVHIRRFDDLPFQFECFAKTQRIATTPEPYYAYRQGRIGQDILARDERLFVHFDIFDYLKPRVLDTARIGTVARLLQVEINTHLWALGRIEPGLRGEYRKRAIQSLRIGYGMLGHRRMLQFAYRAGRAGFMLALGSLISRGNAGTDTIDGGNYFHHAHQPSLQSSNFNSV
jgi:glycosyltransferase involved in cell wall biosynthesis